MNGKLIVIEGLDGSGKATQSGKLYEYLTASGKNAIKISFPNYSSDSSALVKMYLHGEFGSAPDSVNPYAASSFYACDRYASFKKDWGDFYKSGGLVIADRYTTSNAIHQCSKLPKQEWTGFLEWLFEYEYRLLGIPKPDEVIYLRAATDVSQKLMSKRYSDDESKKDIHESDLNHLNASRLAADHCARTLGWKTIECTKDGKMRPIDEIFADILSVLEL